MNRQFQARRRAVGTVALLALVLILLAAPMESAAMLSTPKVGQLAPNFAVPNLMGETVRLTNLVGQPVLIVFWSPFCSHCQVSLPEINSVYGDWVKNYNLEVLAVDVSTSKADVIVFATSKKLTFPVLFGNDVVSARYGIENIPAYFFVDATGVIRFMHVGGLTPAELQQRIVAALAATAKK